MYLLKDLITKIEYSENSAIYAEGKNPNSPARIGQTQFENGGVLDNMHFILNGEQANDWLIEFSDGDDEFLQEHSSPEEFIDWLVDEGYI